MVTAKPSMTGCASGPAARARICGSAHSSGSDARRRRACAAGALPRASRPAPSGARARRDRRRRRQIRRRAAVQCPGADRIRFVAAYHEIIRAPQVTGDQYVGTRCDVYLSGHSVAGFLRAGYFRTARPPASASAAPTRAFRCASQRLICARWPILPAPRRSAARARRFRIKPLRRWDNGRDVVLAGDAAGVVAPASGEGIYYAMAGGRFAAAAVVELLETGNPARYGPRGGGS